MANVQEIQKLKDVFEMGFIGIGEYEERMAALDPSFVASSAQQQQQLDEPHDTYSSTFGYSDGGSGSVMGFGSTGSEYQSISYSGSHATDDEPPLPQHPPPPLPDDQYNYNSNHNDAGNTTTASATDLYGSSLYTAPLYDFNERTPISTSGSLDHTWQLPCASSSSEPCVTPNAQSVCCTRRTKVLLQSLLSRAEQHSQCAQCLQSDQQIDSHWGVCDSVCIADCITRPASRSGQPNAL
jgi:hypothetical protein